MPIRRVLAIRASPRFRATGARDAWEFSRQGQSWALAQTRRMGMQNDRMQLAQCAEVFALPSYDPRGHVGVAQRLYFSTCARRRDRCRSGEMPIRRYADLQAY